MRAANARAGRAVVVLDDDPTGSQSVHDVELLLVEDPALLKTAINGPAPACFALTNNRALDEPQARRVTRRLADHVYRIAADASRPVDIVSRSDSCLRGHVVAEISELRAAARRSGHPLDGILFVPALLSAGRFTEDNVHYAVIDGVPRPVAETEFARDRTFGYQNSNLVQFLGEVSGGAIRAESVLTISLADIRHGGQGRISDVLARAHDEAWIIVNATAEADLDVVAASVREAQAAGSTFGFRTGPSFVRALVGQSPRGPLEASDIHLAGDGTGAGLVVAGSHTHTTTDQLDALLRRQSMRVVDLNVNRVLDPVERDRYLRSVSDRVVRAGKAAEDVLLATSRTALLGSGANASLDRARLISEAVVRVVSASVPASRFSWVLAKGGITSHDVASGGLGIRRARVVGHFPCGGVTLLEPLDAPRGTLGRPYVVFPGNVGSPDALAETVELLRAARFSSAGP